MNLISNTWILFKNAESILFNKNLFDTDITFTFCHKVNLLFFSFNVYLIHDHICDFCSLVELAAWKVKCLFQLVLVMWELYDWWLFWKGCTSGSTSFRLGVHAWRQIPKLVHFTPKTSRRKEEFIFFSIYR